MTITGRLLTALPGKSTVTALRQLVDDARGADPLAPVDVVVPSSLAGVTLRRAVAAEGGLANVRFSSLPQLAERLAVRHLALNGEQRRRTLTAAQQARAVRAALASAEAPPGSLAAAVLRHRATAGLVESLLAELDAAGVHPDTAPDGLTARGREVLELLAAVRVGTSEFADELEVLQAAAQALHNGAAPPTHVVLLAHGRYDDHERALLTALHELGRLSAVVVTVAAEDSGDGAWVARLLGGSAPDVLQPTLSSVRLLAAPDAEEEVRIAVRTVLEQLERTQCRPERIGIAYGSSAPYVRLLAEQLSVAGLPHHVPRQRTLAQTVPGRVVLGLLDLHRRKHPRPDVLRWLADGPLLTAESRPVPTASWERISRDAGISRGLQTWHDRLDRYATDQVARAAEVPDDAPDLERQRQRYARRAEQAHELQSAVADLGEHAQAVLTADTWAAVSDALRAALRRCLGGHKEVERWARVEADPTHVRLEQQSYDAVAAAVGSLAQRDDEGSTPTADDIVSAVEDALDVTVPSGTTLGRGVLVAPVSQFAGADLDLLLVVGMAEGALPTRVRQHAVLRDDDRALLSPALRTSRSARADERANWVQALHGARQVVLSYARADSRSQRRQFPSAWYVEQAAAMAGRPVGVGEFDATATGLAAAEWFRSVPSFLASSMTATTLASAHEHDVAVALQGGVDALATLDPRLARGLEAARARGTAGFSAWTGSTGPLPPTLLQQVDAHHSSSRLQEWATCPARYLFGKVLGVRALEDRADEDVVDARDKGTLFHSVLEQLMEPELDRAPEAAWTRGDVERAQQLLTDGAASLQARGLTGRHVLWTAQLAQLRRALSRVLAADSRQRREQGARPVALEAAFGRAGADPLVVDLPTQGPVEFAGFIDRIDRTDAGRLVVVDYKTGSGYGRDSIPELHKPKPDADLIDRGRRLQLLLYALAARQLRGVPGAEVDAYYWYIELGERRGGSITPEHEHRLVDVLDVVVSGIRNGVYPVNPGGESWRSGKSWDNCTYCDFHRVCPTTRAEQWRAVADDPRVLPYAAVTDPATEDAP